MKFPAAALTLVVCLLSVSCAAAPAPLALGTVGPAPRGVAPVAATGTLVVFSAFETGVPGSFAPDDVRHHGDYTLVDASGQKLRNVRNRAGGFGEDPLSLSLAPGTYEVRARANGFGAVRVKVVVAADRTTVLHLEGGASWPADSAFTADNAVRLPDGQVIGWKSDSPDAR
ncbi:MAG TPA: hypothetical protein VHD32_02680 [Candidatus Didemnitutus sp.]|nr:hypothetical protein [Candidatus Didemnitutus sp.]